ncbi:DEAD/DEAH box helicase [Maricaulis salignorans]|uniref:DEAD-box ATP-dependent RNA helicase RhpA n=1 Tax=Maricaulis salignorans TaxID=144026 RepID=A0A1G9UF98_9PROT|nr:DEAD/DEAH box helicase [Maricaulis salignorans]SDM58621.1 Superfamily II DNA and RNA helicase [Maricaulis salignorans]
MTFEDLGLSPKLLTAITAAGYTEPTPIQAGAIKPALTGRDVLGIAQTGTGKTAAFVLPLIELLSRGRAKARMPRSLIIAPTRELAAQCAENFEAYAKGQRLSMALLIGGVAFGPQQAILDRGADVLIATPGRLLDHFGRGKLLLNGVQILVVDEADRMLDMGFIPDLEKIFSLTPPRRQTLFFSATMPNEIKSLIDRFLNDPIRVEVGRPATAGANIEQYMVRVRDAQPKTKRTALREAMTRTGVKNGIIFCNRKRDVDTVARELTKYGIPASPIHGDLDQSVRTATLAGFKDDSIRFLVASDVAARGLDIPDVSHVFNYDMPHNADDYVHRIGRTGRAGKAGTSITIFAPGDEKNLDAILKLIRQDIPDLPLEGAAPAAPAAAAPAPAADAAAPAASSEAGEEAAAQRTPRGRRSTRKPREPKAQAAPAAAETPAPVTAQPDAPAKPAAPVAPDAPAPAAAKPAPVTPEPRNPPRAAKSESTRNSRSGERKSGSRRGQGDGPDRDVLGFGEHVPGFMQTEG